MEFEVLHNKIAQSKIKQVANQNSEHTTEKKLTQVKYQDTKNYVINPRRGKHPKSNIKVVLVLKKEGIHPVQYSLSCEKWPSMIFI